MSARKILRIAHRGAVSQAPENTLAAFERAIQLGADMIELDVRQSADGHLVVIHDETVDRTTDGHGPVGAMTLRQLKALDAGAWMDQEFAGERIPTLREALALMRGRVQVSIDLKAGSEVYPGIEARVATLVREMGCLDEVIVMAEDCAVIQRMRCLEPGLRTACYRYQALRLRCAVGQECHGGYVFVWPEELSSSLIRRAHSRGWKVITSLERRAVEEPAEMRRLARLGVDGILSNHIGLLVRTLTELDDEEEQERRFESPRHLGGGAAGPPGQRLPQGGQ